MACSAGVSVALGNCARSQLGMPLPVENGGAFPQSSVCPLKSNPRLSPHASSASARSNDMTPGDGSPTRHLRLVSATTKFV